MLALRGLDGPVLQALGQLIESQTGSIRIRSVSKHLNWDRSLLAYFTALHPDVGYLPGRKGSCPARPIQVKQRDDLAARLGARNVGCCP
jgi:hypothetical protein